MAKADLKSTDQLTLEALQELSRLDNDDEEKIDIHGYLRTILKHKWGIISLAITAAIVATIYASTLEPRYQTSATIQFEPKTGNYGTMQDAIAMEVYRAYRAEKTFQTQRAIMQSRSFAERVVDSLQLWDHSFFDPSVERPSRASLKIDWGKYLPDWITLFDDAPQIQRTKEQRRAIAINTIKGGLTVNQVEGTSLIRIGFKSTEPKFATEMANAISELFIEYDLETRLETFEKANSFLTEKTKDLRSALDESERELQDFRNKEQLVNLESGGSILGAQTEDSFNSLMTAQKKRIELEKLFRDADDLKSLPPSEAANHPFLIQYENIKASKASENEALLQIRQLAKRYGPKHPKMIAAKTIHDAAQERLKKEVEIVLNNIGKELDQAKWSEDRLQKKFDELQEKSQEVALKQAKLNTLQRGVDADKQLYDIFLTRFKETNISSDVNTPNAHIVDRALTPGAPYYPNTQRIVIMAIGGAIFLGIMLAFFLEYLNNTIKNSEEVEEKLGLPLLGTLQLLIPKKNDNTEEFKPERMYLEQPKSVFAESIRTIRTGVMLSSLDSPYKIVTVTSTLPGEGKTTISINLAISLGQLERVLLIDADMRRATLGPHFGFSKNNPGLSDLVAGTHKFSECIHQLKDANIDVLSAGVIPPNPQELLSSHRFEEVLHKLSEHYDRIVIDTAPTQLVSDPILVANQASAVVYVVRAESTPFQLARDGVRKLRQLDTPIIGAVLNQMNYAAGRYGRYGSYGRYGRYGRYGKYGYDNYNYTYDDVAYGEAKTNLKKATNKAAAS